MKLAEALYERANLQRYLAVLADRLEDLAQVQEGDTPPEDPAQIIQEYSATNKRLEQLVARINHVNATTLFDESRTLTQALALRERLKREFDMYNRVAQRASKNQVRWTRSEIKLVSTVNVADLRAHANQVAQQIRDVDMKIQELNWSIEL
ncbi:DIP1984 family protein [Corynebacterium felinum]|uniref:Uncharacterized protein (DUF3084 family) n=1 Tax=Corynebacterium felinum TaxID=131318 RepID=A0ABU2B8C2_9CORY|nr:MULTISPECIES: DIP1984 family protein [Corynebacterium]MDF5820211.1 DIP1984 family protein [Corynebacterium felinum]MDO4762400.1 DIP1984 family protein [Corynebacterium sp.]MDR7354850.1 uncharacterized protein (DUF3084 family) [Corynebacterium felinum]WJY94210.1 hypothetical protein CFELI_02840 [Corynebacterium felinum]